MEHFSVASNEELERAIYKELLFYEEDLYTLAHILRRQLPKRFFIRLYLKLVSRRVANGN